MQGGNARSLPDAGLCGRHDGAAIRHADQRYADRTGRTSAHSVGSARRPAAAHDGQPTFVSLPQPVTHERIDVRQEPGIRYPDPVNHVRIVERTGASLRNPVRPPARPKARRRPAAPDQGALRAPRRARRCPPHLSRVRHDLELIGLENGFSFRLRRNEVRRTDACNLDPFFSSQQWSTNSAA